MGELRWASVKGVVLGDARLNAGCELPVAIAPKNNPGAFAQIAPFMHDKTIIFPNCRSTQASGQAHRYQFDSFVVARESTPFAIPGTTKPSMREL